MPTLSQKLGITAPVSPLVRKARRLGIENVHDMIALAVVRGCSHYAPGAKPLARPPTCGELGDDELTILLTSGENAYEPTAIRCAAQLARSPSIDPAKLARLAIMEKSARVLAHIARAGMVHDHDGAAFWRDLLDRLPPVPERSEPDLPHWSRFVSMPGIQRSANPIPRWLVPIP